MGHLQEVRKVMRGKLWVNMLRQTLQKLHITDDEVIQILEQGCYTRPRKQKDTNQGENIEDDLSHLQVSRMIRNL